MALDGSTGGVVRIAMFPEDSETGEMTLTGRLVKRRKSKLVPGGVAFLFEVDEGARELLRVHVADPRVVWVDLEDLPESRLPGEVDYVGGAFVKLFGKVTPGPWRFRAAFSKNLGMAEVLAEGQRELLETPKEAYRKQAQYVLALARERCGVELGFGVAFIPKAAKIMAEFGLEEIAASPHREHLFGRILYLWDAYFGECLVEEFGGSWLVDPHEGELVVLPRAGLPAVRASPIFAVGRGLRGRDAKSVLEWVERVRRALSSTEFDVPVVK